MSVFDHPDFDNHELVVFKSDPVSGLSSIIAVHNSNLGPAIGGCRMYDYGSADEALSDVLRLSRGMTYKSALAGIPLGGGKSVIIGDSKTQKTRELILEMAAFIDGLGGKYIVAEDSGTGVNDMEVIAERTQYVAGVMADEKYRGDPSPMTAMGVFQGIIASVNYTFSTDLKAMRVVIQGVGNVGLHLARMLKNAGAKVYVADISEVNINRAVAELGVEKVELRDVLSMDVEVFSPCAMGGVINKESIQKIKAKIVAGAANNQLASLDLGQQLIDRGILYAPDYIINAGGIIDVYYQTIGIRNKEKISDHVKTIGDTLLNVFNTSKKQNRPTNLIADTLAEAIFCS